jgi:hypothetical protein
MVDLFKVCLGSNTIIYPCLSIDHLSPMLTVGKNRKGERSGREFKEDLFFFERQSEMYSFP